MAQRNISQLRQHDMIKLPLVYNVYIRFYDVFLFLAINGFALLLMNDVHEWLRLPFVIYTVLFMLFLILSPKSNPGRTHYQLMWTALKLDKRIYYSIDKNDFIYDKKE